jgi:hypothetical protein
MTGWCPPVARPFSVPGAATSSSPTVQGMGPRPTVRPRVCQQPALRAPKSSGGRPRGTPRQPCRPRRPLEPPRLRLAPAPSTRRKSSGASVRTQPRRRLPPRPDEHKSSVGRRSRGRPCPPRRAAPAPKSSGGRRPLQRPRQPTLQPVGRRAWGELRLRIPPSRRLRELAGRRCSGVPPHSIPPSQRLQGLAGRRRWGALRLRTLPSQRLPRPGGRKSSGGLLLRTLLSQRLRKGAGRKSLVARLPASRSYRLPLEPATPRFSERRPHRCPPVRQPLNGRKSSVPRHPSHRGSLRRLRLYPRPQQPSPRPRFPWPGVLDRRHFCRGRSSWVRAQGQPFRWTLSRPLPEGRMPPSFTGGRRAAPRPSRRHPTQRRVLQRTVPPARTLAPSSSAGRQRQ